MFNKKTALAAVLAASVAWQAYLPHSHAAAEEYSAQFHIFQSSYTNGEGKHSLAVAPYIVNGHSMVPLRALAESLGSNVAWDSSGKTATLTGSSFGSIQVSPGNDVAINDKGEEVKLGQAAALVEGTVMVPARAIGLLVGASLTWNAENRSLTFKLAKEDEKPFNARYQFDDGYEGWEGGFADLPVEYNEDIYELEFARALLPIGDSNQSNYGLKLKGMNRSDDLFMFLTKKVEGLAPNTEYEVKLDFSMYTDQAGGMFGVGGSPAESVFVKAGVIGKKPEAVQTDDGGDRYYRMNVDIGHQAQEGKDAAIVGNIAKPDSELEGYQRVEFNHSAIVKTNANGELYLLIGTDSGYEGLTTLYFDDIRVSASRI